MKFYQLPEHIQIQAAIALKEAIVAYQVNEKEPAEKLAQAIKASFEKLYLD